MRKAIFLLGLLLLASCYQTQPDVPDVASTPQVLGIGSVDIAMPGTDIQPASFESGYVNIPSELELTALPVTQLTFGTANGVSGRYLLTRVQLRNVSGRNLNNLTLLGISLAGRDQSLTPYSNVLTIPGDPVVDSNLLYQLKPSQPMSVDGITNASFVAFDESDLDSDLRNTINGIPGVTVDAVFPYGFRVGNVTPGQNATVDIGFFIPDGNPVGRFSFRFVAVTDGLERVTQGIDEIDVDGTRDNGYAAVRQRFGNPATGKTLVLTGPFEREVSQADIDSGIFTLLPDIRIAGTAGSSSATLFDSATTTPAQVSAPAQSQPTGVSALSNLTSNTAEPAAGSQANVTYAWTVTGSGTCTLNLGYGQPTQTIEPCAGSQTYTHTYDAWQNYHFAELTVTDGDGFNETRVHSFLPSDTYDILRQTNDFRTQAQTCGGQAYPAASPLRWDTLVANAATAHSQDMAARNYYAHVSPEGGTVGDRLTAAGYAFRGWGENIAWSSFQRDYSETLNSWIESPGHCRNLMRPRYVDFGFGYALDTTPPPHEFVTERHYYTQKFGVPD